jgi:hypothetical protein
MMGNHDFAGDRQAQSRTVVLTARSRRVPPVEALEDVR